jgi:hypothetical protein
MRIAGAGNAGALKRLEDVLVSQPFPLLSARRYPHYELLGFDVRVCTDDQALCSSFLTWLPSQVAARGLMGEHHDVHAGHCPGK